MPYIYFWGGKNKLVITIEINSAQFHTADPWAAQVWTAQVHLHVDFFFFQQICTSVTQSAVGWIHGYRGLTVKLHADFPLQRVSASNPHVIQGSSVQSKYSIVYVVKTFNENKTKNQQIHMYKIKAIGSQRKPKILE